MKGETGRKLNDFEGKGKKTRGGNARGKLVSSGKWKSWPDSKWKLRQGGGRNRRGERWPRVTRLPVTMVAEGAFLRAIVAVVLEVDLVELGRRLS